MSDPSARAEVVRWRGAAATAAVRCVPAETPIALVHDAATTAIMLASPTDLEDLAVGFTLTEGIAGGIAEIAAFEIVAAGEGIEARVWLKADASTRLAARRRRLAGATGCGLCGIESLEEALRPLGEVGSILHLRAADIAVALEALAARQSLGRATRAAHAAGWYAPGSGLAVVREDVGRHNALDKLAGAIARQGVARSGGVVVLTSRVSIEMVQKAVVLGAEAIIAVSAPTALAIEAARRAGLTLVAVARADGFEVFTHPQRISG